VPGPGAGTGADEDLMASLDRRQLLDQWIDRRFAAVHQALPADFDHAHLGQNGVIGRHITCLHEFRVVQRPTHQQ
jgi:hypothetical protein